MRCLCEKRRRIRYLVSSTYNLFKLISLFAFVDGFCTSKHPIDINKAKHQGISSILLDTNTKTQDNGIKKTDNNRLDRKAILRLNQRRLPKQILSCRADTQKALNILENAYPHLQVSHRLIEVDDIDCLYDSLLDILNYEGCYSKKHDDIQIVDGKTIIATLEIIRKANDVPVVVVVALELLRLTTVAVQHNQEVLHIDEGILRDDKNELRRVYKSVISLLGHTSKRLESSSRLILYILHHHMPEVSKIKPGAEIYHAAINSLGKGGQCSVILDILEEMEQSSNSQTETNAPPIDKMSYQTAISSLARHGYCREAVQLLYQMQDEGWVSDMSIYNELLIGIAKQASQQLEKSDEPWHKVSLRLLSEMEMNGIQPTEQTYNSIISACVKEGAWGDVAKVTEKARLTTSKDHDRVSKDKPPVTNTTHRSHGTTYFNNLLPFRKVGKGQDSWWEVGRYQHIIIGIQPHRNPMSNGMSMVFYDEANGDKMGRILLRNTCKKKSQSEIHYYSSIVGMEVSIARRGEGLSKVFVAIWLLLCIETNTYMRATVMNKPLIVHVLMGFNFIPQHGGSRVELIRLKNSDTRDKREDGYSPNFALYSPSAKSLQGLFSQRVLRTQGIMVMDYPPSPEERKNGSVIYLKTTFEHPIAVLDNVVDYTPPLNEESKVDTSWEGSAIQRRQLVGKIDDVLGKGIDFFSNSTRLKNAFHYS